jgi:hypothetical protein
LGGDFVKNVDIKVDGDKSKEFGPSKSGKTIIVATTEGADVVLGLNYYNYINWFEIATHGNLLF